MAYFAHGQMWREWNRARCVFVTTNGTINKQGELVMGRGAADEAKRLVPGIARRFGEQATNHYLQWGSEEPYGLLLDTKSTIGAFQVKYHWAHRAKLELIEYSAAMLRDYALEKPDKQVFLNFPGIGFGKLNLDEVLERLEILPDNVVLWTRFKLPQLTYEASFKS
jgi:hypothetical protein